MSARHKLIIVAAAVFLVLAAAAAVVVLKNGPPAQQAKTQAPVHVQDGLPAIPEKEPPPTARVEATPQDTGHMFFPTAGKDQQEKPAAQPADESQKAEEKPEAGPVEPAPKQPAAQQAAAKQVGEKKKLSMQGGGAGGGPGRNLGGGMGGGGGYAMPAAAQAGTAAGGGGSPVKPPLEGFASGNVANKSPEGSSDQGARGGLKGSGRKLRSNVSSVPDSLVPADSKSGTVFKKDPRGERSTTTDEIRPGLIRMDDGQWIHVIEVGGVSQDKTTSPSSSGGGAAGGGTIGGGGAGTTPGPTPTVPGGRH